MIYNIIEIANTHNGSYEYLNDLVDQFEGYSEGFGLKFQIFKYDEIAKEDFVNYENFKRFYFTSEQWSRLITKAQKTKEVWLDVFDSYGVQILSENLDKVSGLKFQVSSLYNLKLVDALAELDLRDKKLMLNIAALEIADIKTVLANFEEKLEVQEIVLQLGFQAYPTEASDSGLVKISELKKHFSNRLAFADHVEGSTEEARWLPVLAATLGVDIIEKHVMLSDRETTIDYFSSLSPEAYASYIGNLRLLEACLTQPFINEREADYLKSSLQIPFLAKDKQAGELLSIADDLEFKRTSQSGLEIPKIKSLLDGYHLIGIPNKKGETLKAYNFKKANIGAIIACRLKSSRLPKKATIKIGSQLSSVEHCIKNTLRFEHISHTVLATSTEEEDAPLENYCYSDSVIFHKGDPIDVIDRYMTIIDRLNLDVVVRITGDNPYVSSEIFSILLDSHFKQGADYTSAKEASPGTSVEIMNVRAMKTIQEFFPRADQSEYMTWYFKNNPDFFKLNYVELPPELIRNYRLSLDYPEDLALMQKIEEHFESTGEIQSTRNIFKFLDANPDVVALNGNLDFSFKTDQKLIDFLNEVTRIPKSES